MGYISGNDSNYDAAMMLAVAIVSGVVLIIYIISVATDWILFRKAGEAGWKAIVPVYNLYVNNKIYFGFGWNCIIPIGLILISAIPMGSTIGSIGMLGYRFVYCHKKAEAFGKSGFYAIALFFLDPFVSVHLALSDAEYRS